MKQQRGLYSKTLAVQRYSTGNIIFILSISLRVCCVSIFEKKQKPNKQNFNVLCLH